MKTMPLPRRLSVAVCSCLASVCFATAPSITSHPQPVTKNKGYDAGFSVTATGTPPFTYQWRKNGNNISGATSQTLVVPNVSLADAANYSVVVTNSHGNATSNNAALTVTDTDADNNNNSIPDVTDQALGTTSSSSTNDSSNSQQQNVHRPNS
jgi:hypothetical protein